MLINGYVTFLVQNDGAISHDSGFLGQARWLQFLIIFTVYKIISSYKNKREIH